MLFIVFNPEGLGNLINLHKQIKEKHKYANISKHAQKQKHRGQPGGGPKGPGNMVRDPAARCGLDFVFPYFYGLLRSVAFRRFVYVN